MKKSCIIAVLLMIVIIAFGCSEKKQLEKTSPQDVQKAQQTKEPAKTAENKTISMTENKKISDEIASTDELDTAINELDDIE